MALLDLSETREMEVNRSVGQILPSVLRFCEVLSLLWWPLISGYTATTATTRLSVFTFQINILILKILYQFFENVIHLYNPLAQLSFLKI